jgi:hypothetical protein
VFISKRNDDLSVFMIQLFLDRGGGAGEKEGEALVKRRAAKGKGREEKGDAVRDGGQESRKIKARSRIGHLGHNSEKTDTALAPEDSQWLVAEDVDDDACDETATYKDVLMLLVGSGVGGIWREELTRVQQAEAKEAQERSVTKVHGWLQSQ